MGEARLKSARDWLVKAQHDLAAARVLSTESDQLLDVAVYHCQQAAEKALKGFLTCRDVPFEKTHDVRLIVLRASDVNRAFDELLDDARLLTPYAHAFRYPDDLMQPSRPQFVEAFAAAERVYRFVLSVHKELDPEAS